MNPSIIIQEFEDMIEMAEIRALSKISLKRPLDDQQYKRLMSLARKQGFPVGEIEK